MMHQYDQITFSIEFPPRDINLDFKMPPHNYAFEMIISRKLVCHLLFYAPKDFAQNELFVAYHQVIREI